MIKYNRFISSYPLINGFCQDSWHIGVDRDWRECKDRQLWVEIDIMFETTAQILEVGLGGKYGYMRANTDIICPY
jgi:hypothetical protein